MNGSLQDVVHVDVVDALQVGGCSVKLCPNRHDWSRRSISSGNACHYAGDIYGKVSNGNQGRSRFRAGR